MKLHLLLVPVQLLHVYFHLNKSELLDYKAYGDITYTVIFILERHTGCCWSVAQCAKLCDVNTKCVSFFYKDISQECQLYSSFLSPFGTLNALNGWLYYYQYEDCSQVYQMGNTQSGVYNVSLNGKRYDVYCDMTTDGGGWTVFQKRFDGSLDFYRGWNDYSNGFGDIKGEFWLGNEFLHELTSKNSYKLRIDMEDYDGIWKYAKYKQFSLSSNVTGYTLIVGSYSGNAGDSLTARHNGREFSTKDKLGSNNCAVTYSGAWWYKSCHHSNLNGLYNVTEYGKGINWYTWHKYKYSLKATEMKIKRI